jgi:hypothetical protein
VIHIEDARPWNVRHNRLIGRKTTLGPLGANLTPQRANHIHVFLGMKHGPSSCCRVSCRVRLNSLLEHAGSAEMRSPRRESLPRRSLTGHHPDCRMQELSGTWRLLNDQLRALEWNWVKPRSSPHYGIPYSPPFCWYVLLQAMHALPSPSLSSYPDYSSDRQALQGYEARLDDGPCASLQSIALVRFPQESPLVHRTF